MSDVLDLLNQNLTADDLEPSLFPDGAQVLFEVKKGALVTNEEGKQALVFDLATLNPEDNNKGTKFPAGYPFTYRINLTTTSQRGNDITHLIKRSMAQFRQAATGQFGPFGSPEDYVGKRVVGIMEVEPERPPYGKRNNIQKFVPLAG